MRHYLKMFQNKLPFHPRDLGVPSGASKMISMCMVHSVQTMRLSCLEINSISKWTEMSLNLTLVTYN
jgi:hypothetical protein